MFSTVRSSTRSIAEEDESGNLIGFLSDERRMNVALTRARFVLIIIGNVKTLSSNLIWRKMINHYHRNQQLVQFDSLHEFEQQSEIIFKHGYLPKENRRVRVEFGKMKKTKNILVFFSSEYKNNKQLFF